MVNKKNVNKNNVNKKADQKKASAAAAKVAPQVVEHIGIVRNDPYLEPYEQAIRGRHDHALWKIDQLMRHGKQTLSDFANGYEYFGLHRTDTGWVFREWAPHATDIYLVGDFSSWKEQETYRLSLIHI